MKPGDIYVFDFPGHELHGRGVQIVRVDGAVDLAPPGASPRPAEIIFIGHPTLPEPVGIGRERLGGTEENVRLRAMLRDESDDAQGELLL